MLMHEPDTVEWIGYAARAYNSTQDPNYSLGPFIVQILLPLVAPALFAASIYMTLGRIILLLNGEYHSIVRRTWLTKIFVLGDVLTFTIQSGGQYRGLSFHALTRTNE